MQPTPFQPRKGLHNVTPRLLVPKVGNLKLIKRGRESQ